MKIYHNFQYIFHSHEKSAQKPVSDSKNGYFYIEKDAKLVIMH